MFWTNGVFCCWVMLYFVCWPSIHLFLLGTTLISVSSHMSHLEMIASPEPKNRQICSNECLAISWHVTQWRALTNARLMKLTFAELLAKENYGALNSQLGHPMGSSPKVIQPTLTQSWELTEEKENLFTHNFKMLTLRFSCSWNLISDYFSFISLGRWK